MPFSKLCPGLEEVGKKFSTGQVSKCYQCQYVQDDDGTVNGLPQCGDEVNAEAGIVPSYQCPLYADTSCFWTAAFHKDLSGARQSCKTYNFENYMLRFPQETVFLNFKVCNF